MNWSFMLLVLVMIWILMVVLCHCNKTENVRLLAFGAIMIAFINIISIAFVLAIIQHYSIINVNVIMLVEILVAVCWSVRHGGLKCPYEKLWKDVNIYFLLAFILVGILYLCFPTYYMWGRRDPSVYFLMGINIADTGGIGIPVNECIENCYNEIKEFVDVAFRGFYSDYMFGETQQASALTAQFLHYFSAALAVGYSLGGIEGLVRVPGIIGLLCMLAAYYFMSTVSNKKVATVMSILLALCPAQIWGAKITQTEGLYQLYLFVGMLIYIFAIRNKSSKLVLFAGIILGMIAFNRIDGYLVGIAVFVVCIYMNVFYPQGHFYNVFTLSYLLTALLGLLISFFTSKYYLIAHGSSLYPLLLLNAVLALFVPIAYLIGQKTTLYRSNFVVKIIDTRIFQGALIAILILLCKFLYCIRPSFQNGMGPDYDFWQRCFVEMFFYIPIFALPFMLWGILIVVKDKEVRLESLPYIACGVACTVLYIFKPAIAADHIWASRRWVSVVFPFWLFLTAFGVEALVSYFSKYKKIVSTTIRVVCVVPMLIYMLYQSKSFLLEKPLVDMVYDYSMLANAMEDDKIYYAPYSHYASYLRLQYGKSAIVLNIEKEEEFYNYVQDSEEPVYYIGDLDWLEYEYEHSLIYKGAVQGEYFDQQREIYTNEMITAGAVTNIYALYPSETDKQ